MRSRKLFVLFLFLFILTVPTFAQGTAPAPGTPVDLKPLVPLAMGIASGLCALGQGKGDRRCSGSNWYPQPRRGGRNSVRPDSRPCADGITGVVHAGCRVPSEVILFQLWFRAGQAGRPPALFHS